MGVTAGIFLASILLKEMRYLVYIRYLWEGLPQPPPPPFVGFPGLIDTIIIHKSVHHPHLQIRNILPFRINLIQE